MARSLSSTANATITSATKYGRTRIEALTYARETVFCILIGPIFSIVLPHHPYMAP